MKKYTGSMKVDFYFRGTYRGTAFVDHDKETFEFSRNGVEPVIAPWIPQNLRRTKFTPDTEFETFSYDEFMEFLRGSQVDPRRHRRKETYHFDLDEVVEEMILTKGSANRYQFDITPYNMNLNPKVWTCELVFDF